MRSGNPKAGCAPGSAHSIGPARRTTKTTIPGVLRPPDPLDLDQSSSSKKIYFMTGAVRSAAVVVAHGLPRPHLRAAQGAMRPLRGCPTGTLGTLAAGRGFSALPTTEAERQTNRRATPNGVALLLRACAYLAQSWLAG